MKPAHREYLRLSIGIGVGIVVAIVAGCSTKPPVSAIVPQIFPKDSLCNPNDAQLAADRGYDNAVIEFARTNGYDGWCIPEYDDDQRLSDGNLPGKDYGAAAHVLAAPWLDTLQPTTAFQQVGILALDDEPGPAPPPYTQLGLSKYNCIYLRQQDAADTSYEAMIIRPGPSGLKCPGTATGGTILVVGVEQPFGTAPEKRILRRRVSSRRVPGERSSVKCSNHWCGIRPTGTPPGFPVALASSSSGGGPLPAAPQDNNILFNYAQARVKGWFDDQYVGVPDNSPKHHIRRQVQAVAIPAQNLGQLEIDRFRSDNAGPHEVYRRWNGDFPGRATAEIKV